MRFCTLDSVLGLGRNRVALLASFLLPNLNRTSREVPLHFVAGVFLCGDEAKVRGDEFECGKSAAS